MFKEIPSNVVFLSGMLGAGKTELKKKIAKELDFVIPYSKCEMTDFTDTFERQIRRIAKYRIDFERICKLATNNPEKIILADRCILDAHAYLDAFLKLGWLSTEEWDMCKRLTKEMFPTNQERPCQVIFIQPSFNKIKETLKQKQDAKGLKWQEDFEKYIRTVYEMYNNLNIMGGEKYYSDDYEKIEKAIKNYLIDLHTTREEIHNDLLKHCHNENTKFTDFSGSMFFQMWGSTCGGFEGIGGSAMTVQRTWVFLPKVDNEDIHVYFDNRYAYSVPKDNKAFMKDLAKNSIAGVGEYKKKYLK